MNREEILEQNAFRKKLMVDDLFSGGNPDNNSDRTMALKLMESIEKVSVVDPQTDKAASVAIAASILRSVARGLEPDIHRSLTLPDALGDNLMIVDGELEMNTSKITLDELYPSNGK